MTAHFIILFKVTQTGYDSDSLIQVAAWPYLFNYSNKVGSFLQGRDEGLSSLCPPLPFKLKGSGQGNSCEVSSLPQLSDEP